MVESQLSRFVNPPHESASARFGISQWIFEEFRIVVSRQTLSRALRKMGYRKLSARPRHHAQAAGAIEDFKKVCPSAWKRSGARKASIRET